MSKTEKYQCRRSLLKAGLALCITIASLTLPRASNKAEAQDSIDANGETIYGLTSSNTLVQFSSAAPGTILSSRAISGLQAGELLLGIDFRPADGRLFALANTSRLYTIIPQTGAATLVSITAFTSTLNGTAFGFDFNPVPDRIRVVSDNEQNLRLNPNNGATAGVDGTLAYSPPVTMPNVVAAAYTNNVSGAVTATLYLIDSDIDSLVLQGGIGGTPSPNLGLLTVVGALGVDASNNVGFDISPAGNAFAAIAAPSATSSSLYSINLGTGAATLVGAIGVSEALVGLAIPTVAPAPLPQETVYGVTASNRLIQFNSAVPGTLSASRVISGLQSGESIVGIDFRPANGQLYGLGSASNVYTINPQTGLATLVGSGPFTATLNGAAFGVDFNPVPDRIRVVSDNEQNLRLNPNNGAVAGIDASLAYTPTDVNAGVNPTIVAAAYTNNVSGAVTTTLYVIDAGTDSLALQGGIGGTPSPNLGRLSTVGSLGVDTSSFLGFDISPTGNAFAAINSPSATTSDFALMNLATGKVTRVGVIGGGEVVVGLAVPTLPTPAPSGELAYALNTNNQLMQFNTATPGTLIWTQPVAGLMVGESLVGIDFRPADGGLYGLSNMSRLYLINRFTAAATMVGTQPFSVTLNGTAFGVDFNPVPDRIRVVSDNDQNLRLNPNNGAIAGVDSTLVYTPSDPNAGMNPNVVAAAYTNNFSGTPSTTLYVIDSNLDVLALQGGANGTPSPNLGQLFTVGALGQDVSNVLGFDISPTGAAYAAIHSFPGGVSTLAVVDLGTGKLTPIGTIGGNFPVIGLAVPTRPGFTLILPLIYR